MNLFKEHKYLVIRNAISFELANFAFNYFLMKRDATQWMHKNNNVSQLTPGLVHGKINKFLILTQFMVILLWKR